MKRKVYRENIEMITIYVKSVVLCYNNCHIKGDIIMENKKKYHYYEKLKDKLINENFNVSDFTEINYGLQFNVESGNTVGLVRVYESKKGTRVDLSQIKDENLARKLESSLLIKKTIESSKKKSLAINSSKDLVYLDSLNELIGVDESGKGDYFGPLVVAGVFINNSSRKELENMGVIDSKKLSDEKIHHLAQKIKLICEYSTVVIGNTRYNVLYDKINNLNNILAWGHARTIENILEKVSCHSALSDQFGNESLIKQSLMEKGRNINLFQMPKAESNLAVAAASILARDEYVNRLRKLSNKYKVELPKGASNLTIQTAKKFVDQYGVGELKNVAKLHFKTTKNI
jgi:ribonuclease HIII